jgi:tetratricopeptide (TPR) repeat protein
MIEKRKGLLCALVLSAGACASSGGGKAKPAQPTEEAVKPAPPPQGELAKAVEADNKPKLEVGKSAEDAYDTALDQAQKILATAPLTESKCKEAAELFAKVAEQNPKIASARYNEGLAYEKCSMHKEAERAYRKALDVNPRYSNAKGGLGVIALKQGNKQDAERLFREALGIDQRCLPALVNMATLLRERAIHSGDKAAVNDAQDNVRKALAVDGTNMAAYTTLALLYYDLAGNDRAKLEMAETVIAQATKINDHYAPLWNASGLVALKKKNVTRALRDFRRAVELDANFAEAHMNIGAITLSFRDYTAAEQSFKTVLKQDPKNLDATIGLGVAYRGQKKIKEAQEQYEQAAKLDPRNCAVPYNLGLLYQDYMSGAEGELKKAQGYYREFASRCGGQDKDKIADADRRIKNIDETFRALAEAAELQREADRIQKQNEQQQKEQEKKEKDKAPGAGGSAPESKKE